MTHKRVVSSLTHECITYNLDHEVVSGQSFLEVHAVESELRLKVTLLTEIHSLLLLLLLRTNILVVIVFVEVE